MKYLTEDEQLREQFVREHARQQRVVAEVVRWLALFGLMVVIAGAVVVCSQIVRIAQHLVGP